MSNLETARAFFAACEQKNWAAMRALLADDVIYHNIPMQPISGADATVAVLQSFMAACEKIVWDCRAIAEGADGRVLSERIDHFIYPDGRAIAIPVMGAMEFQAGKISAWRDYFDLADFQRQMAPPS
jgi:limonene-1,2-epoxide hydrolase